MAWCTVALAFANQASAQTATVTATQQQSCVGTLWANANGGGGLNCTSKDFATTLTFTQPSATAITSCVAGTFINVDVIGSVTSGSSNRYDIGYYFGEVGNNPENITTGESCSTGIFPKLPNPPFRDTDSDACGEFFGSSTATLQVDNVRLLCAPQPGSNSLGLPYVLVFSNNDTASCTGPATLLPGTTAKCRSSAADSGTLNGVGVVTGLTVNGFVTVTKQTLPDTQPGSFAFTTSASPAATVTPSTQSLSDNGSETFAVPLVAAGTRTLTITETALAGWDSTASITCTTPSGGSAASYVTADNTNRTITANLTAANYGALCTVTNTKRPEIRVQKITTGGLGGPFAIAGTNIASTIADISTAAADTATPASPTSVYASTMGQDVQLTESHSLTWVSGTSTCADSNASRTGNPTPVATGTGASVTIAGARVVAGANITCVFTNPLAVPSLSLTKTANVASVDDMGDTVVYSLAVTNTGNTTLASLTVSDSLGIVVCPTSGNSSIATLLAGGSETCTVTYAVPVAQFDTNGGGDGDIDNTADVATTYNGGSVAANGSTAVSLVLDQTLTVVKSASTTGPVNVGQVITYTYRVTNTGNQTLISINVSDVTNGHGGTPVPGSETLLPADDAAPTGDSTDGGVNGVWDNLKPNDTVQFTAT